MIGTVYLDYNPTETQPVSETEIESVNVEVHTQSEIAEDTDLYSQGDVISGSMYLNQTNPELDIVYEVETDREIEADKDIHVSVVGEEEEFRFWDEQIPVQQEDDLIIDDEYAEFATVDIEHIRDRSVQVRNQYDDDGVLLVNIVFELDYDTEDYSGSIEEEMQIIFRDNTYSVLPPEWEDSNSHSFDVFVGEEEVGDEVFINVGIISGIIGLILLLVRFGIANPSRIRKDYLMIRFGDWVSTSKSDSRLETDENVVELSECEDIVDVAADTNGRVIYYDSEEKLAVHERGRCFVYEFTDEELSKVRFDWKEYIGLKDSTSDNNDENSDNNDESRYKRDEGFRFVE